MEKTIKIKDPRRYTIDYPEKNMIIKQALDVIVGNITTEDLVASIAHVLKNKNDTLINVALNLSPSFFVSKTIWEALHQAIYANNDEVTAHVFALPLVLVAGSKTKAILKSDLNVTKLNKYFIEHSIFDNSIDSFISGKLIDPSTLATLKPSQFYYWVRNIANANLGLPIKLEGSPIEVLNEGVFLRFLCGVTISNSWLAINFDAFRKSSIGLMKLIAEELKCEEVTLFPIPFTPVEVSESYHIGDSYRKEIAHSVMLSNVIKKMRENGKTPEVKISTLDEAIHLSVTTVEESNLKDEALWHLTKFDEFSQVLARLTDLLDDMQVRYIYVV